MERIERNRAEELIRTIGGWTLGGDALTREFTFGGFADALSFVVRLGFTAEAADHHPDLRINYKRVTVTYTTHSAGGLTRKDFDGASAANELALRFGAAGA